MNPEARELLARARAADRLDSSAGRRIAEGVFEKLARGEGALPGIDVSPVVVHKTGIWGMLRSSGAIKALISIAVVGLSAAAFHALRVEQPVARSLPLTAAVTAPAMLQPPAAVVIESLSPRVPEKEPQRTVHGARARSAPVTEPHVTLRAADSAAAAGADAKRSAAPAPSVGKARPQLRAAVSARIATSAAAKLSMAPGSAAQLPAAAVVSPAGDAAAKRMVRAADASRSAAPATTHLEAELGLLRRAYSALHAGKPADAQALLDEHAERFPRGALEEPREVARIAVLCKLGRERAAHVRADNFLATRPKSPFVERVRHLCSSNATE